MNDRSVNFSGRVLLVDDLPMNQMVAAGILSQLGVDVDVADSGAEALGMIEKASYDLVFMDIHMPDMDGLEVSRRIRAREDAEGGRHLPVIALTAVSKEEDKQACIDAGMDGHMGKPLMREALIKILGRYLGTGGDTATALDDGPVALLIPDGIDKARFEDLSDTMRGIPDGVADVLGDYMESVTRLTGEIAAGLRDNDLELLVRAAHSLKSNSMTVGALALSDLARQIEETGRQGRTDGCGDMAQRIGLEFDHIRPGLKDMIVRLGKEKIGT